MKKSLLKKIIMAVSSFLAIFMTFFIRVSATNELVLGDSVTTRDAGSSSFFEFISAASDSDKFNLARVFMLIGFIVIIISAIYFISLLVFEFIGKNNIFKKFSLVTRVMEFVIVIGVLFILFAGLDKEQIKMGGIAKETLDITLFNFSFVLTFIFSMIPLTSEYLIKE